MKKQTRKISIKRINIRQEKLERIRTKSLEKKKQRNIKNNSKKTSFIEQKPKNQNKYRQQNRKITAHPNFSLIEFPENVLSFISDIENSTLNTRIKVIILNMREVKNIDIGCISILLSKINKLTQRKIQAICNLPTDDECLKMFYEFGFTDHMRDLQGRRIIYSRTNNNLMVNRGFIKQVMKK